jgi:FKBP-type peptidyl-prolyl cis-trans isomerase SlyD
MSLVSSGPAHRNIGQIPSGEFGMIKSGIVASLAYSLKDDEGTILDSADAQDPFTYLHGHGNIIPGLERALEGLKIGDRRKLSVTPEDGYGDVDETLRVVVEKSQLGAETAIKKGMRFGAQSEDGEEVVYTVVDVKGDEIFLDGNHPLAGVTLHFEVEVLKMREATSEELSHGHVHGPGGHHH